MLPVPMLCAIPGLTSVSDPVLIIGAGVAGLSAASALRAAGVDCVLVEASNRIGGRAYTTQVGGYAFDHGASWLHAAKRNPLTPIALGHGETLTDSAETRTRRVLVDGRRATMAELQDRSQLYERFEQVASDETSDISVAAAVDGLRDNPWLATIEAWEASQIAAADSRDLSVQDWRINLLEGKNLSIAGGLGSFVQRRLGPMAGAVVLGTPVTRIDWTGPIVAETASGSIRASACIVTASTSALKRIRFFPELPVSLDGLPMGLLTKFAIRATGANRLGLAADESVSARIGRGDPMLSVLAWPGGADHLVAFIGGPPAWALSREGEAGTIDFVRERLRDWFGGEANQALGEITVANWANDPWHGGAYAYARPGHWQDRALLGAPFGDGRLVIAGEACRTDGLAGTVGGAWLDGERAAAIVQEALARPA